MLVVCLLVALASGQSTAPPLPQHISDFTDPATGRNPFLDLQEGPPGGRGLHRPPLDFELVEGGAEDRRRGFPAPPTTTVAPPTITTPPIKEEEPEKEEGVAVSMVTVVVASAAAAALLTALMGVVWWKWRRRSTSPFSAAENGQLRKS